MFSAFTCTGSEPSSAEPGRCRCSARLLVQGASLLQQSLALGGLATHSLEALDVQGLARLLHGGVPLRDALVSLLAVGGRLLKNNLAGLALGQLVLSQTTDSLHLATREDGAGGTSAGLVALGDDGLLHGFLAHSHGLLHLHRLHALLHLHGG